MVGLRCADGWTPPTVGLQQPAEEAWPSVAPGGEDCAGRWFTPMIGWLRKPAAVAGFACAVANGPVVSAEVWVGG